MEGGRDGGGGREGGREGEPVQPGLELQPSPPNWDRRIYSLHPETSAFWRHLLLHRRPAQKGPRNSNRSHRCSFNLLNLHTFFLYVF